MMDRHDAAALFPGWERRELPLQDGVLACRLTGAADAPPLLLLHGFPQTGAMWAAVAGQLAAMDHWRLIVPDLPGYGESRLAETTPERMSKRRLAEDLVGAMAALGHARFAVAGHDRGGRVAYRLAFDRPDVVSRVAVLDITPTLTYWERCADRGFAAKIYHWTMLAQPYPVPEELIAPSPRAYLERLIASWTATGDLSAFAPAALEAYAEQIADPVRRKAMCDDYRAGAGVDPDHDAEDRAAGRRIAAPLLALWGDVGIAAQKSTVLDVWRDWAAQVEGAPIASGHFLPEERPVETAEALARFFTA